MASFSSAWGVQGADGSTPVVAVQQESSAEGVHALTLSTLPLMLKRADQPSDPEHQVSCELELAWRVHPLQCRQFKLEIVSSARHVELFIEGVRRSLLGEDEQGEVYLGTFRGVRQGAPGYGSAAAKTAPQLFSISEEFCQRDSKHNILKEMQKLRVKFVSLTGDKTRLHLPELKCSYIPIQKAYVPSPAPVDVPSAQAQAISSSQVQPEAAASPNIAAQLAGLSLHGGAGGFGGFDTQVVMQGFQQMLEREMECKIMKALDEKLSALSQRLAFSEQRLLLLHHQMETKDAHVQAALDQIKQQFAQLETSVKKQLSSSVTNSNAETEGE